MSQEELLKAQWSGSTDIPLREFVDRNQVAVCHEDYEVWLVSSDPPGTRPPDEPGEPPIPPIIPPVVGTLVLPWMEDTVLLVPR